MKTQVDKDSSGSLNPILALQQIAEARGLEVDMIISGLEAALVSAYKKYQPGNSNIEIKINMDTGGINVWELRTIVEDQDHLKNPDAEFTLADAQRLGFKNALPGETVKIERNPKNFGRIAAQTARQVITQRLRDAERTTVYNRYAEKVGDMINGVVFKLDGDQVLVKLNERTDAFLPRKEQISGEKYVPGMTMKFYVLDVKQTSRGPRITVSRTHPGLLRRLMELEIPEIQQGIIEIKSISRDGGARAKVAITTLDPNVEPVGACVGNGGNRIKAVSNALKGEKIDLLLWSSDPDVYVRNALSPAQVSKVDVNPEDPTQVTAYVYPDQLSLAIGKLGQNVRLAAKLTNWKIDIKTVEPDRMPTLKDIFTEAGDIAKNLLQETLTQTQSENPEQPEQTHRQTYQTERPERPKFTRPNNRNNSNFRQKRRPQQAYNRDNRGNRTRNNFDDAINLLGGGNVIGLPTAKSETEQSNDE